MDIPCDGIIDRSEGAQRGTSFCDRGTNLARALRARAHQVWQGALCWSILTLMPPPAQEAQQKYRVSVTLHNGYADGWRVREKMGCAIPPASAVAGGAAVTLPSTVPKAGRAMTLALLGAPVEIGRGGESSCPSTTPRCSRRPKPISDGHSKYTQTPTEKEGGMLYSRRAVTDGWGYFEPRLPVDCVHNTGD